MDSILPPPRISTPRRVVTHVALTPLKKQAKQIIKPESRSQKIVSTVLFAIVAATSIFIWHAIRTNEIYVVRSGSMEPAIATGAVIAVREQLAYNVGDIITFRSAKGTTTHRIVERLQEGGQTKYRTKGDANNATDPKLVSHDIIIGATNNSVPYLGYILRSLHTKAGFALIILLPATIVMLLELNNMRRTWHDLRAMRLTMQTAFAALLLVSLPVTYALLSDTAELQSTSLSTAAVFPTPTPTETPTPEPTPTPTDSPTPTPDVAGDCDVDVDQSNTNTGPGSTNVNISEHDCNSQTTIIEQTTIENDIEINANTSGNDSGDISTSVTITNQ